MATQRTRKIPPYPPLEKGGWGDFQVKEEINHVQQAVNQLTEKILEDDSFRISYEEACGLAAFPEDETIDLIMCANEVRQKFKHNKAVTCSITNAKSGCCTEDCAFCAQSAYHETDIAAHAHVAS